MKRIITSFCLIILCYLPGCKRHLTHQDTEKELKGAMDNFLNTSKNIDHSKISFNVLDVTYFEDSTFYECEFKVHLQQPGHDTTGVMTARISKDFTRVSRKY